MNEKISVIIPFYNRIAFTLESIKSVENQTYQNYEIILVDDGSSEDTTSLESYIKGNKRIRFIRQTNMGVSAARNNGLKMASGEYIAFLDSDDLFKPDKLEKQLFLMKQSGAVFSHTSYEQIDLEGQFIQTLTSGKLGGKVFPEIIRVCPIATPTVMIKKEVLSGINEPFNTGFHLGEDICLWIDIAYSHELLGIEEALTQVRVCETSAVQNNEKQILGLLNIINYTIRNPKYGAYKKEIAHLAGGLKYYLDPSVEEVVLQDITLPRRIYRKLKRIVKHFFCSKSN